MSDGSVQHALLIIKSPADSENMASEERFQAVGKLKTFFDF